MTRKALRILFGALTVFHVAACLVNVIFQGSTSLHLKWMGLPITGAGFCIPLLGATLLLVAISLFVFGKKTS